MKIGLRSNNAAEDRLQFWRPSPRAEVHSLTRVGSTIWICGSFGVLRFTDGQFVRAPGDPEQLRWPARRISVAPAGDLWIATAGHGVLRLSRDGALRHWNSDDGIARSTYGVAHLADGRTLVASSAGLLQTSGDGLEPAPEAPQEPLSRFNPEYFHRIAFDENGQPLGPWRIFYSGNEMNVNKIVDILPEVIVVETEGAGGKVQRMRIPYTKIEDVTRL